MNINNLFSLSLKTCRFNEECLSNPSILLRVSLFSSFFFSIRKIFVTILQKYCVVVTVYYNIVHRARSVYSIVTMYNFVLYNNNINSLIFHHSLTHHMYDEIPQISNTKKIRQKKSHERAIHTRNVSTW